MTLRRATIEELHQSASRDAQEWRLLLSLSSWKLKQLSGNIPLSSSQFNDSEVNLFKHSLCCACPEVHDYTGWTCTCTHTHADVVDGLWVNLCITSKHQGWAEDSVPYNEEEIVNLALTPGFPWGNTMIQGGEQWSSVCIQAHSLSLYLSLSVSLPLFFPRFTMVIRTHHKERLNERGVKRTSISNRELSGSPWGLAWVTSALRSRTPRVGASTGPVSLRQAPNEAPQQDTEIREQWEPPFISRGLALP